MPLAGPPPPVFNFVKALKKTAHRLGWDDTKWRGDFLKTRQMIGQFFGAQPTPGACIHCLDPQFFGTIMLLVEIFGHSLETRTVTKRLPAAGFVGRAAKKLSIDKAFHQHD